MIYRFRGLSFDTDTRELRTASGVTPLEPQVAALLLMLLENRHRLVTRDEVVDHVWQGRIVSESAISSRVKTLRRALGDDGATQAVVRTAPKLGFRFVAEVETSGVRPSATATATADPRPEPGPDLLRPAAERPSIAVLPFTVLRAQAAGGPEGDLGLADAIPHDLIADLSRLRWLMVIARASSFRFRGETLDHAQVRSALGVRYILTGAVETEGARLSVSVELADTQDGGVLWGERFGGRLDEVHEIRARIVQSVIAALELRIPLNEARRARLNSPENLDAWSAYHLGLRHMYRFTPDGNRQAAALFAQAIQGEPGFARAHAGLSFTHFEDAFLSFGARSEAAMAARRSAEAGLEQDPLDPFCNLVMGRVYWLDGQLEASLPWLDRALDLNPNYAQARYSRGWTEALLGEDRAARGSVDAALRLSPLDPLAYGMLAVRAFSLLGGGDFGPAAACAERAAQSPGAHPLIEMIAAIAHQAAGDEAQARRWMASARRRRPDLGAAAFFRAFPFAQGPLRARIEQAATRLGGGPHA